jgi:hypothetical protein
MKKILIQITLIFTSILFISSCNVFNKEVFEIKEIKFNNGIFWELEKGYITSYDKTIYLIPYKIEMEYNGGDLFYLSNGVRLRIENINKTTKIHDPQYYGSVLTDINKNELDIDEFKKYKEKKYFIYGLYEVNDYLYKIIDNNTPFDLNSILYIFYGDSKSNKLVSSIGYNEIFEHQEKLDDKIKNVFINKIKTPKTIYKNIDIDELIYKYFSEKEGVKFIKKI